MPQLLISIFSSIKLIGTSFKDNLTLFTQSPVDFSFLIAIFLIFLVIWVLKLFIESISFSEKIFFKTYRTIKKYEEDNFNKQLMKDYIKEEYKNNNCLLLVKFEVSEINSENLYDEDISEIDKLKLQNEVQSEFFSLLEGNLDTCESEFLDNNDGLVLSFNPFCDVNGIFLDLKNILRMVKKKYNEKGIEVTYYVGVETYAQNKSLPMKKERLKKLIDLGYGNDLICLSTFKQRYSLVRRKKYVFNSLGVFRICEEETVYLIKEA